MTASFFCGRGAGRAVLGHGLLAVGVLWASAGAVAPARAQFAGQDVPTLRYRATFGLYHDGEYLDALKSFQSEGRGAIKTAQSRWIDSICYHTMCGECLYQMGRLPDAMDHYISAINLYIAFSDWMVRVRFPELRPGQPPGARYRVTWGQSRRASRPAQFPRTVLLTQGRLDAGEVFREGGTFQPAKSFGVDVVEIVRCTTLAIRRRSELLGPVSAHDPLTDRLLAALSSRPGLPNHWSECWIDLALGLAQRAAGKDVQALPTLKRAVAAAGQFDHPMTDVALLELGKIAMAQGNFKEAADLFLEATYSAAYFQNIDVLEEAFRCGAVVHLVTNQKDVYPPLAEAARWAGRNRFTQLQCSLLLSLAENYAALGQTKPAATALDEAGRLLGRRDMGAGRLGGRHAFLSAMVRYQGGDLAGGDKALLEAMGYMRQGSLWLYQMQLADGLFTAGTITSHAAMELFANVLRDPRAEDWSYDPAECLASLTTPHPIPLEHWFNVALQLNREETAFEIADRVRRHRYFSSRALGGRLDSLRWILEGPEEVLDNEARLHRRDLLLRFPTYAELRKQAETLRNELAKAPVVPQDAQAAAAQKQQLEDLAILAQRREAQLRGIAVRREPAALVFPPLRSTDEVRKALPEGHAMMAFLVANGQLHGFLLNNAEYHHWRVVAPAAVAKGAAALLRALGHHDGNREFPLKELTDARWQKAAEELLATILRDSKADLGTEFKQLIVVPDGVLWYVPFEMLQVAKDGKLESLISRVQIRYAPTVGLAIADGRGRRATERTGVVLGRLWPRDEPEVAQAALAKLSASLPGTVALPRPLPAPAAVYRVLLDRLIVLDDLPASAAGGYLWAPLPEGLGHPESTLADWMRLPWGGPEAVILPGYHTAAENSLKQLSPATAGQEVFLSVCGLLASGTRTVLLSRWRTAGQSSLQLVEEFAQELPHAPPAEAWQRAVLLAQDSRLDLDAEPRVKRTATDESPKAPPPFFWAGYLLIDPGQRPAAPRDVAPPVFKPEAPAEEKPVAEKPAAEKQPAAENK